MINLEKCKNEFLKYTEKFNFEKEGIKRKQLHSLRVMGESKKVAKALKLNKEEIELAELIGLLHDIGRFEQYNRENEQCNEMLLDHANLGVEILVKDDYIKKYIDDKYYIPIILKAIKNHNKLKIEDDLNEEELLYAKIIRDADKLDIFYEGVEIYWNTKKEKENIENSKISSKIEEQLKNEKQVKKLGNERNDTVDSLLMLLSYIYDINFRKTLERIDKENYVNKILNRFDFKDEKTKEQIEELKEILLKFIKTSLIKK